MGSRYLGEQHLHRKNNLRKSVVTFAAYETFSLLHADYNIAAHSKQQKK
jgi:hypothetical protein